MVSQQDFKYVLYPSPCKEIPEQVGDDKKSVGGFFDGVYPELVEWAQDDSTEGDSRVTHP